MDAAIGLGPQAIREIEHCWIPLSDGARLSARIWLPVDAESAPVPAILEYLPYNKDDGTAAGDSARHPYFASHGYAAVRVDIRGTGDSDGVLLGEYLVSEQDDALEVLAWLADQPWCSGECGMIGYSWGGFNGLQVAARRPPELKAIVTMYSTDDRYTDDCHWQGGCLLGSDMLKWAEWMHALNGRPGDPRFVGKEWRELWRRRLVATPPYIGDWMAHPRCDEYWKQGSVREDYSAIHAAVLAVGGWADPYTNSVPRLIEHLTCPVRGIIGPWSHVVPHGGIPGPAIGFLQECVRWFDRWLKDVDTGVESDPLLRAWIQESQPPAAYYATRPGRWVAESAWPPPHVESRSWVLRSDGALTAGGTGDESPPVELSILGDQTCGFTSGVWCPNGMTDELPIDQRSDDEVSLCFDTPVLAEPLEMLGRPVLRLALTVDKPLALVSARLCAVAPDGASTLMTWGLLNLTHRDGSEHPAAMEVGKRCDVEIELNVVGERVPAGHRLRLALSPTYWPQAWPSPEPVNLGVLTDGPSVLELPVRHATVREVEPCFEEPVRSGPLHGRIEEEAARTRVRTRDPDTGEVLINDEQVYATFITPTGTRMREGANDSWSIAPDDPLSARVTARREITLQREGWSVRVVTEAEQTCTATTIETETSLRAFEGDVEVFSDSQRFSTPRDLY
jgi:putative CocE/NonD family hydrolase